MRLLAAALLVLTIAACGTSTSQAVPPAASTATGPGALARAGFLSYSFANVRDGSTFTLSDFPGKSVLVIGMAVW